MRKRDSVFEPQKRLTLVGVSTRLNLYQLSYFPKGEA